MLNAIGDSGQAVDWWFMYKLPRNAHPPDNPHSPQRSTGFEYVYFDTHSTSLSLSSHVLTDKGGALYSTLQQIYPLDPASPLGWIIYNDERIDGKPDNGELGHTKGVLAFDPATDTAFWLLHSTPRFPTLDGPDFPDDEKIYAQTYLCITLKDVATAQAIAAQMCHQQEPQVYSFHLPAGIQPGSPLQQLTQPLAVSDASPPSDIQFLSRGGQPFRAIAKNRHWGQDFWNDLVGPHLNVDLDVETWRRGTLAGTADSDGRHHIVDTLFINLAPLGVDYEWHYTQDHAKWARGCTEDWVCVADINRDTSQEKRGGGGICFQNQVLWNSLSQVDTLKSVPAGAARPGRPGAA